MSEHMDIEKARFLLDNLTSMHRTFERLLDEGDLPVPLIVAVTGIDAQIDLTVKILGRYVTALGDAA